jgi:hypothetical protein
VSNPRGFFKKGRVFMTRAATHQGSSDTALFAVVKSKATHAVCLPIDRSTGSGISLSTIAPNEYADIVLVTDAYEQHENDDKSIYVKVEGNAVSIEPGSRINFAKPCTLEYNTKIRNVGRVFGESLRAMEERFAEALGLTK